MSILNIITHPNPNLRKKSKEIKVSDIKTPEIQRFIKKLSHTMRVKDGVGLASPQVDKPLRIIAINTKEGSLILINPKIKRKSIRKETMEEGCLSLPNIFCMIKRSKGITVECYDKKGNILNFKAQGMFARVIQHEIDHLDGVLIIDKAKKTIKKEKSDEKKL